MSSKYSVEVIRNLRQRFKDTGVVRPPLALWHEPGDELCYEASPVAHRGVTAKVRLRIEAFVGGGFAGQVYRVRALETEGDGLDGVRSDGVYALKLLVPPSRFSLFFRNMLYGVGFQGAFQQQCNPAAARAGALWQKFIRRGAGLRFGDESVVNDVHATVVDGTIGSCGEISDWIDGRTWRLEINDRLDFLALWRRGLEVSPILLGSPEYRAKRTFMRDFVELLNDMGAHEFARQYEWWTCKSQPNCLKRRVADSDPERGLVAVDFRAGLALLPFLPMSPGDVALIVKGFARGSLVQFDRGNLQALDSFVSSRAEEFGDMQNMLEELHDVERVYRDSVPDITHNHVRLLASRRLWSTMLSSALVGWRVRNIIDDGAYQRLRNNRFAVLLFSMLGKIPLLGGFVRRLWGREDWRRHYASIIRSPAYLLKALRARRIEAVHGWHRAGRLDERQAPRVAESPLSYLLHAPLSNLPVGVHRFLTNGAHFRQCLHDIFLRPVKLYFDADMREQWLREMVDEGRRKHIVSADDAATILGSLKESYIQKYLKSLAVHVCTMPVTQVVSLLIVALAVMTHPEWSRAEAAAYSAGIILAFQVVPISPGSLVRGLYVLFLVIRERNFRDYNIAVFLGFFKYVGYLAFPIQMTYRYPALARFMAGHWATEAVHIVPVFGERGALLEHWAFNLFYNWPLTLRRRIRERLARRAVLPTRFWHIPLSVTVGAALLFSAEFVLVRMHGALPEISTIGWAIVFVAIANGAIVTAGAGGMGLGWRIASAALSGTAFSALGSVAVAVVVTYSFPGISIEPRGVIAGTVWGMFIATTFSSLGAIVTEMLLADPAVRETVVANRSTRPITAINATEE